MKDSAECGGSRNVEHVIWQQGYVTTLTEELASWSGWSFAMEKLIDPRDLLYVIYDKYTTRPIMQKALYYWVIIGNV